jgi:hypothetical protein
MQAVPSQRGNLNKINTQRRYADMRHTKSRRNANSGDPQRKGQTLDLIHD